MSDFKHSHDKKKIAVFASGKGTNAENLIHYFSNHPLAEVALVLSNNPQAEVTTRAEKLNVSTFLFNKEQLNHTNDVLNILKNAKIDWIVLAGFLLKFPVSIIEKYPDHIINIHPALLPNYGGKGMYGMHVHKAVVKNKEKETGISIHYVNENYDEGAIVFQAKTDVLANDTPENVADKIQQLEFEHFPKVLEKLIEKDFDG